MGRPKKIIEVVEKTINESIVKSPGLIEKTETLKLILKTKSPGIFEREPAPAFAEGNLNKLVEDIICLLKK